jgi:hypothetical protein
MKEEIEKVAREYFDLGCRVVPFNVKEKRPLVEWQRWQNNDQTLKDFQTMPWIEADGFALICGTQLNNGAFLGVVDYDVKNLPPEIVEKGRKVVTQLPITRMEKTKSGGVHLVYYCKTKPNTVSAYHNSIALELIGEKKLCIMAPSMDYVALNDNTPTQINDLEQIFCSVLGNAEVKVREKKNVWFDQETYGEKQHFHGVDPPCIAKLLDGTEEGLRNEYGIRLAAYYRNFKGNQQKKVLATMDNWNKNNSPSLDKEEILELYRSAVRGGYIYGCNDPIFGKFCVREECKLRPPTRIEQLTEVDKQKAVEFTLSHCMTDYVLKYGKKRLIGEDDVLLTTFIEIVSGQTKYPISAIIEGYSGSGKNEAIRAIKQLIPSEWLFEFTTSTAEAVKYIPEEFAGTLIIYEAAGMESKTGTLGLRAIGEGESIETIYPMRDEETGKMTLGRAKTNAKNFITTESALDVHPDLYRRVLKTSMNHGLGLTKRVLAKKLREAQLPRSLENLLNKNGTSEEELKVFRNALELINWKAEVVLFSPFNLIDLLEVTVTTEQKVALRTHMEKILNFIKIVALLNQAKRPRFESLEEKYVVASPEDVWFSLELLQPTIMATITRLGGRQKEVLELFEATPKLDKHTVATELRVSEVSSAKALKSLYTLGYLQEDQKVKPYQYQMLNKPNLLVILEKTSEYVSFYLEKLEAILNCTSSLDPPLTQFIPPDFISHLKGEDKKIRLSEAEQEQKREKNQTALVKSEMTSGKGLDEIKSLYRVPTNALTQSFESVKCDFCGYQKTISWQAETFKNETLLICDGCVQEYEKKASLTG